MQSLNNLFADLAFRLSILTILDVVDLLLVAATFYLVLALVRRSRAALLLRGAISVATLLFIITVVLPLPTFDRIVWAAIISILIATPITLQPELRRWLESIGSQNRLTRAVRQTFAERVVPILVQSAAALSQSRTGALLVIQGRTPLDDVIKSGVRVEGTVSPELLQTIFSDKTPLHDGAVIVREDEVLAAATILPLTEQFLVARRRLGTRHRAAVGMSEETDALVVVVSEETGAISLAHNGALTYDLEPAALRERLYDFYLSTGVAQDEEGWQWQRPTVRELGAILLQSLTAFALALLVWSAILEQTNPTERVTIDAVELLVLEPPAGTVVRNEIDATVTITVQTTEAVASTLNAQSFQATLDLSTLEPDLQRVAVAVESSLDEVSVVSIEPAGFDIDLDTVLTTTLPVELVISDRDDFSQSFELGATSVTPSETIVSGPEEQVSQVERVVAQVRIGNAATSLRDERPLLPVDVDGMVVEGVSVMPERAVVNIAILQRRDARDVAVQVVTTGTPPEGYWVSGWSVEPAGVTLRGAPSALAELDNFVSTVPVDVTDAVGPLSVSMALDLPTDIIAVDADGNRINTVQVGVNVVPLQGEETLTVDIELVNQPVGSSVTLDPVQVDLLLSGPVPTLRAIAEDRSLVRVIIDLSGVPLAQETRVTPTLVLPDGVVGRVVQGTVLITIE